MRPRKPQRGWEFNNPGVLTQGRRFRLIWKYVFRELFVVQYHGRFPEFFVGKDFKNEKKRENAWTKQREISL